MGMRPRPLMVMATPPIKGALLFEVPIFLLGIQEGARANVASSPDSQLEGDGFEPPVRRAGTMLVAMLVMLTAGATAHAKMEMRTFPVLAGAGAHDVYPAPDGAVWFTAQSAGKLGRLDPRTGKSDLIALGPGAAPHGVIVGPDGAAWVTEGGQNAIARVDPATRAVKLFPLPKERRAANLNTATFDHQGILWFTGQNGVYGRLDPKSGTMAVFDAPRGTGPYGITTTPEGRVFFASLAGNYLGRIDIETGTTTVLEPPVPQGARRVRGRRPGRTRAADFCRGHAVHYPGRHSAASRPRTG